MKKTYLAAIAVFSVLPFVSKAQWLGTNPVYFNAGNVGIGTSFPNATLDVTGTEHFQAASGADSTSLFQVQNAVGSSALPDMDALPSTVRAWLESAYGHGIADVFLYAAPFALIAFVVVLFIKEVPLRTTSALQERDE